MTIFENLKTTVKFRHFVESGNNKSLKWFNDHSKKLPQAIHRKKKDQKVTEEMIVSQTAEVLKISTRSLYRLKKPTKSDSEFRASMSKKIKELKTKINPIMQSSIREIVYKMCAEKNTLQ
jgi:hypothetical protein